MGFFTTILSNRNLSTHDGRPLWNYGLSDFEFAQLQSELNQVRLYNLDARDVTLYFAEWWKRHYNGGSPKIQDVFNSLGRVDTNVLNAQIFYESARYGAEILRIKWIQKQNTLYFRTILLQGGIPIRHISANKSYYQNFLLGLLELQPNTVEDIITEVQLTNLLPVSSRNETIYENCLAIIKSILNEEDTYTSLLEDNNALKEIRTALQVRKHQLSKAARIVRPKIFWVMNLKDGVGNIYLRIGFGSKYTASSLSEILSLSEPADKKTYHIYLDERLICLFKKTLEGDYKTDWENQNLYRWNSERLVPQFYCVCNDERWEINDLIPVQPTIDAPTLWSAICDTEWRLIKGNAINTANALLLFPTDWQHFSEQNEVVSLDDHPLKAIQFEGAISIAKADLVYTFCSGVDSFEWNIRTEKPSWMRKSEIVVVNRQLKIHVYDNNGRIVTPNAYKIYLKGSNSNDSWQLSDGHNPLPTGLINIKIERNGVIAYDTAYNICDLNLVIGEQKLDSATLKWNNHHLFDISVTESNKFFARSDNNSFYLQLNTGQLSIPDAIPFKLKFRNQKSLHFDIASPFSGIGLVDKDGILLNEGAVLTLNNLNAIRFLTTSTGETIVKFWNKLRDQVKISKNIRLTNQSLIDFKEDLKRLFYLADAMRHDNLAMIEISNGRSKKNYCVKGFSHSINDVSTQFERKIIVNGGNEQLQLFAIPLYTNPEEIQLLSMQADTDNHYHLSQDIANGQFIVISNISNGKQLQPRFINTDPAYEGKSASERINIYHSVLLESDYSSMAWKEFQTYYNICLQQQIPFSAFDQIRAIGRSSTLAAKAFFALGIMQEDNDEFIQRQIPLLEQDLGFCFHWIKKEDWENAINSTSDFCLENYHNNYRDKLFGLMAKYFKEIALGDLYKYLLGQATYMSRVTNQVIKEARCKLGDRVMNELPKHTPHTTNDYRLPIDDNLMIKLLLRAPMAVAEAINGIAEKSIWNDDDFVANLRRNIQYAQFLAPDLYSKVLYHCLS
jgi:hypothetical protein